jgi:hypothetical protein
MNRFDPDREKSLLLGDCGIEFYLGMDIEEAKAVGGLASSADGYLQMAIQCFLVGMDEPAVRLLQKAHQWLVIAIAEKEKPQRYAPDGTEALRLHNLAICRWLLHAEHDAESFQQVVQHEDRFLASSGLWKNRVEVSLALPAYVDGGAFQRALEIFDGTAGLSAPETPRQAKSEAQMAYVLCRQHLDKPYGESEISSAARNFLVKNIDKWLGAGHCVRAAEWLKIIYWNDTDQTLSSKSVLMNCYDYMPGRSSPG